MQNANVAAMFDEIAALMEVAGENSFKIRAYQRAAEAVATHSHPIEDAAENNSLRSIEGLGEATSAKVQEFLATGRVAYLERLREEYPSGLLDVLRVPGLGPKKVAQLHRECHISSLESLKTALETGALVGVSGFGPKALQNIAQGLQRLSQLTKRLPIGDALPFATTSASTCSTLSGVSRIEIGGSLRRGCDTVGDINLLAQTSDTEATLNEFEKSNFVLGIAPREENTSVIHARGGIEVRLRAVENNFAGVWFENTGSQSHLETARARATELGLNWLQVLADASDEADIYRALQVPFIAPELRENKGEWQAAIENRLPNLLQIADIKGDLHAHSTWSDGSASIAQMATAMQARGYQYFAVTDHSKALAMANGLNAQRLREQGEEIAAVREQFPEMLILRGIECDILRDGLLDLDDDILHELDWVIASVHSGFSLDEAAQTERMIRAIRHPAVDLIAHPTGRILGGRPGYDVNIPALIEAAKEHKTALEINASQRLDLNDENARLARDAGVLLCIDTDAHSTRMLNNLELGVFTARRAWCESKDVLNTKTADELRAWLGRAKSQR